MPLPLLAGLGVALALGGAATGIAQGITGAKSAKNKKNFLLNSLNKQNEFFYQSQLPLAQYKRDRSLGSTRSQLVGTGQAVGSLGYNNILFNEQSMLDNSINLDIKAQQIKYNAALQEIEMGYQGESSQSIFGGINSVLGSVSSGINIMGSFKSGSGSKPQINNSNTSS